MNLKEFDDSYRTEAIEFIAGFDEAGRGPLCGPVVCAGAVMKKDFFHPLIDDSKKLNPRQREEAYRIIVENALAYKIIFIDALTIDQINILESSRLGMQLALDNLIARGQKVDLVMTDYMKLKTTLPLLALIHGDGTSFSIACASILAKVARDRYMGELSNQYPLYEFNSHKGYPTKRHLEILEKYGPLKDIYRFSYKPVRKYR